MEYTVDGRTLKLRDKATFYQVQQAMELIESLDVNEQTPMFTVVSKIGDKIADVMAIVFDTQHDDVTAVNWREVEFDTVVEILTGFLSTSAQLKGLLRI